MNSKNLNMLLEQINNFNVEIERKDEYELKEQKAQGEFSTVIHAQLSEESIGNIDNDNPLKPVMVNVAIQVTKTLNAIEAKTKSLRDRLSLQADYRDKLIIIIFGKVNAGKSTFANYLSELIGLKTGYKSKLFHFVDGKKEQFEGSKFSEGSTETTITIQGIEIGNLVLLDSPGLHSVNDANGELAKNYTDSADLVIWLTSSTSPGQTQELESLKEELVKKKVLVPVISKSDEIVEDEVDDEIVEEFKMKNVAVQKDQQSDVYQRITKFFIKKGLPIDDCLKEPCSISVGYAKKNNELTLSGMEGLFRNIAEVYKEVIDSKVNNIKNQSENYLKEVRAEFKILEKVIEDTLAEIKAQKENIGKTSQVIADNILLDSKIELPNLIDDAKSVNDKKRAKIKLINSLDSFLRNKLEFYVNQEFEDIFKTLTKKASSGIKTNLNSQADFEDDTYIYSEKNGKVSAAAVSSTATIIGGVLGSMVPGAGTMAGAAVGSVVGGVLGSLAGSYLVEDIEVKEVIGVSSEKIEADLNRSLNNAIPEIVNQVVQNLMQHLLPLEERLKTVKQEIRKV